MTIPNFKIDGSEDLRALLAVMIWQGDRTELQSVVWDSEVQEQYLAKAQQLLESSYRNFKHPAQELGNDVT